MVVGKALDNLKDKPHEEKKVVAGGIAVAVVIVLLIAWAFLFIHKIQKSGAIPTLETSTVPEDQFNAQFLQQTQQQINTQYQQPTDELRAIRDSSAQSQVQGSANSPSVSPNDNVDGFGASQSDF